MRSSSTRNSNMRLRSVLRSTFKYSDNNKQGSDCGDRKQQRTATTNNDNNGNINKQNNNTGAIGRSAGSAHHHHHHHHRNSRNRKKRYGSNISWNFNYRWAKSYEENTSVQEENSDLFDIGKLDAGYEREEKELEDRSWDDLDYEGTIEHYRDSSEGAKLCNVVNIRNNDGIPDSDAHDDDEVDDSTRHEQHQDVAANDNDDYDNVGHLQQQARGSGNNNRRRSSSLRRKKKRGSLTNMASSFSRFTRRYSGSSMRRSSTSVRCSFGTRSRYGRNQGGGGDDDDDDEDNNVVVVEDKDETPVVAPVILMREESSHQGNLTDIDPNDMFKNNVQIIMRNDKCGSEVREAATETMSRLNLGESNTLHSGNSTIDGTYTEIRKKASDLKESVDNPYNSAVTSKGEEDVNEDESEPPPILMREMSSHSGSEINRDPNALLSSDDKMSPRNSQSNDPELIAFLQALLDNTEPH